jgi:hypothetical protein
MIGSYFMVVQVYKSLQMNQIMVTIEGKATGFEEVPFPAVTFIDRVQMSIPNLATLDLRVNDFQVYNTLE